MTFIRKPLLFLLVLACTASLAASGRFSLRLLFDTSIALGVVPLIQLVAFAIVFWTGRRPMGFRFAVDTYFDGLWPWFAALSILGVFGAVASPMVAAEWVSRLGAICMTMALVLSMRVDWLYSREVLGRASPRAVADVVLQRAVAWSATIVYFLITALPKAGSIWPDVASNVFGARP